MPFAAAERTPAALNGAFVRQFRAFYTELVALRETVRAQEASGVSKREAAAVQPFGPVIAIEQDYGVAGATALARNPALRGGDFGDPLFQDVQRKLIALLEGQAVEAERRAGEYGAITYREAQYAMAALADEMISSVQWSGRERWKRDLLETRLFGTYSASQVVFQRIDTLLEEQEFAHAELALIYLMVLALGFRGRYRGEEGEKVIGDYKRRLFAFVFACQPGQNANRTKLLPAAYEATTSDSRIAKLPSPLRWVAFLGAAVACFALAQHILWEKTAGGLDLWLRMGGQP